ncbi:putative F-box/FBD/LRR-repeat protein At3g49040 [Arabidopsis lyrata subsp. lyrata]|uniref:putative F-box/FBD/LRR-repeat protein At3g49040 n=1 Tax=Arabidopsis lyrata subsp. lyrata TaxID=81972 RepID=UPI000A29D6F5|nr:putative F-box/FBD/LRR-repeat protein At3g49040 [Arabidopsis lyrata subsp. lyrata]|eukprot:XP_020879991.1 putative F-box/FBD/LRR-repeat protein At3g49040 [Arabidopsis lyrata subsp. lyrata]
MEQQCESGGECLSNGDVVNEDRISELHEALLVHIMSSLPTKTVVATSVLSKRWRHVWETVQNLKFDSKYHRTFLEDVYRFFMLHKALFLESFHLEIRHRYDASNVGILIGIAFARHVRNLVLDLDYIFYYDDVGSTVINPSVLCIYDNNTLETLTLKHSILLDFPYRVCLKSLRKLHLYYVRFRNKESVCNLLGGCPSLEDLVVHRSYKLFVSEKTFTIAVPSLQRLTVQDYYQDYYHRGGGGEGGYVINAPSLKYLNIEGFYKREFCLIENASELVEAKVSDVCDINYENILQSLTSAKRLSLHFSPLEIKYPSGSIFHQLVYLELHTDKWKRWNLLSLMLDGCPKLQILKLIDVPIYVFQQRKSDRRKWNQPKCVPECLVFHLETFVWIGYEWQRRDEKEVATYILSNTRCLKKATFSTKPIEPVELKKLEKRLEMLNELASLGRASNPCHFVFESM